MTYRHLTRISLRTKFVIFIGAIISFSFFYMLHRTSVFENEMIILNAKQQARMLYKQILLTRQWVSEHSGLFVLKTEDIEPNPFLDFPIVQDKEGRTYVMRNPAMVTRELSQYANKYGVGHFRVTSLNPVNPTNKADDFERESMLHFKEGMEEIAAIRDTENGRVVRYLAPLYTEPSCLECHASHGYTKGDIRGALSITIPINWADQLIKKNNHTLVAIGITTILIVTVSLFLMFESLVVRRISRISDAMDHFPKPLPNRHIYGSIFKDEVDTLHNHFSRFRDDLLRSQKELEKTRLQAWFNEKMASLGILTAGIAHEINNPLGGMLNCVKAMKENPDNIELHKRYLPLIDKGLRQIEHIMKQLLNFGRTKPLQLGEVDIKQLIDECVELLSFKLKDITLNVNVTVSKHYSLNAEAFRQIIINIGLNAIQAMPSGGKLDIFVKQKEDDLYLIIKDTGMGIAQDTLNHIFDPFFTTKDVGEGTGLGLAVTYSLTQQLKGDINVESEEGVGTAFTIRFPLKHLNNSE